MLGIRQAVRLGGMASTARGVCGDGSWRSTEGQPSEGRDGSPLKRESAGNRRRATVALSRGLADSKQARPLLECSRGTDHPNTAVTSLGCLWLSLRCETWRRLKQQHLQLPLLPGTASRRQECIQLTQIFTVFSTWPFTCFPLKTSPSP